VGAVVGRGLATKLLKQAIKMRERLKTGCKDDFTHPQVGFSIKLLTFFDPNPRNVMRESYTVHLKGASESVEIVCNPTPNDTTIFGSRTMRT
jgi:hypothetical protein